jgi:hypothetical protein
VANATYLIGHSATPMRMVPHHPFHHVTIKATCSAKKVQATCTRPSQPKSDEHCTLEAGARSLSIRFTRLCFASFPRSDQLSTMAFRLPSGQLCKAVTVPAFATRSLRPFAYSNHASQQLRRLATPAYPVTQNAVGSRGPTAMVFLNMGGPSTVDEVGDFLSRLFVGFLLIQASHDTR